MINNLVNYNYNFLGGIFPFKNCKLAKAFGNAIPANTTTDLYTCPSGKKAFILSGMILQGNDAVQATNGKLYIKNNGNYYLHVSNLNEASISSRTVRGFNSSIYLDENESLAININQIVNCWFQVYEFDKSTNIKINRILNFSSGNNTLYTCPANTIAIPATIGLTNIYGSNATPSFQTLLCNTPGYSNGGVSSVTTVFYTVPTGETASNWPSCVSNTYTSGSSTIPYGTFGVVPGTMFLTAGDSIVINTNSNQAGQHAWYYCFEVPT